jgi:glutamine amidotransferase
MLAGEESPLDGRGLRIPHIGWNDVRFDRPSPLTAGLPGDSCAFYHVHSLVVRPGNPADVVATAEYGERFATIVGHGTVFGVQFHPEKSSRDGLTLLSNFVTLCRDSAPAGWAAS